VSEAEADAEPEPEPDAEPEPEPEPEPKPESGIRARTHCWAGAVAWKTRDCPRCPPSTITGSAPVHLWPPKPRTNRGCEFVCPLPIARGGKSNDSEWAPAIF
jgi:hypothetical protein